MKSDLTAEQLAMFQYNMELDKARRQRDDVVEDLQNCNAALTDLQSKLDAARDCLKKCDQVLDDHHFSSSDGEDYNNDDIIEAHDLVRETLAKIGEK